MTMSTTSLKLRQGCFLAGIFLCATLCIVNAHAETLAVIVNPNVTIDTLSKRTVINIFMGRQTELDNKTLATPLDLEDSSSLRSSFYKYLVNRDLAEINSYWAQLLFSGKSQPPTKVNTINEVLHRVASNKSAIAYVPLSVVNDTVKVVYTLETEEQ